MEGRGIPASYLAAVVQLELPRGKWQWLSAVDSRMIPAFSLLGEYGRNRCFADFLRTLCGLSR